MKGQRINEIKPGESITVSMAICVKEKNKVGNGDWKSWDVGNCNLR